MTTRRCNSEACSLAAVKRSVSLDMPLATVLESPARDWNHLTMGNNRVAKRIIDVDWKKYNQDDFLFSHCSIVCSVATEDNGFYIKPCCNELVNNNGNAWTNQVLLATFKSFIGGENYCEHVQIPALSKGKIIDAVIRPIKQVNDLGESDILWCDILVATDRKHEDLVKRIVTGKLNTMSMGCEASMVTCSKCGKVLGDNDKNCRCLDKEMLQYFTDPQGVKRIVAELCGRMVKQNGIWVGDPKSVKFIEASWVERPAFVGAVLNHFVSEERKVAQQVLAFDDRHLEATMTDIFKLRVADVTGMTVLRVARAEWIRRQHEAMISRVASGLYWGK